MPSRCLIRQYCDSHGIRLWHTPSNSPSQRTVFLPSYLVYCCQLNETIYKHSIDIQAKIIAYNPSPPPTIIDTISTISFTVINLGTSDSWRQLMIRIPLGCEGCFSVLFILCHPSCPIIISVICVIILKI
jgi:hypothetical protein